MDQLDLISEVYSCKTRVQNLVNNELLSDVSFLVGDDKIKIYGHQLILSLGSPVFYKMFYGDLKTFETIPIPIIDLEPTGFLNMIRYIYGNGIESELKLEDIYETYKACDKYLVYDFTKALSAYIEKILNYSNCTLIYDQLFKTEDETLIKLRDLSKKYIQLHTKSAVESKFFTRINLDTLIDILKMENLDINEIDLLVASEKWIDSELDRRKLYSNLKNKQDLFKLIRNYINYNKITVDELCKFENIKNLFTTEEIGQLFLHLNFDNNPFFDYFKISRESFKLSSICTNHSNPITNNQFKFILSSKKDLIIKSFLTTSLNITGTNLILLIYENDKSKDLRFSWTIPNSKAFIEFCKNRLFHIKANVDYKLAFYFNSHKSTKIDDLDKFSDLSEHFELKDKEETIFHLKFKGSTYIEKIEYYTI